MLQPTSGTAFIGGHDIRTSMGIIRQSLGICPQFDILWPDITVAEHLQLYAVIKGATWADASTQVQHAAAEVRLPATILAKSAGRAPAIDICSRSAQPALQNLHAHGRQMMQCVIEVGCDMSPQGLMSAGCSWSTPCFLYCLPYLQVGLSDKLSCLAAELSGGQRRKLSVAIAFLGSPAVVFLDEPTSGMDPYSRRTTWDVIRRRCCVVCMVGAVLGTCDAGLLCSVALYSVVLSTT